MRLAASLTALLCTAVSRCLAEDESAIASKIIALEQAWNQAYKLGDKRGLDALLDDHIVLINDDGTIQTVRKRCHRDRSLSRQGSRRR
jgi:hypothetical protein